VCVRVALFRRTLLYESVTNNIFIHVLWCSNYWPMWKLWTSHKITRHEQLRVREPLHLSCFKLYQQSNAFYDRIFRLSKRCLGIVSSILLYHTEIWVPFLVISLPGVMEYHREELDVYRLRQWLGEKFRSRKEVEEKPAWWRRRAVFGGNVDSN
jgi:hypothetical protein